jgi:hypothetical protein
MYYDCTHCELGYKLREMISKSLSTQSKVLKTAITKYNTLARNADLPRPELTTRDVMEMTKVADFKLLRESRRDILTQKWARPEIREATNHALRVSRAREELLCIQVEACRLQTWMHDEMHHLNCTLQHLEADAPLLAHALRLRATYQTRINSVIMESIRHIELHQYYNGKSGCGTRQKSADLTGFTLYSFSAENPVGEGGDRSKETNQSDGPVESDGDDDIDDEIANLADGYARIAVASCT